MIIESIRVEAFGRLSGYTCAPGEGLAALITGAGSDTIKRLGKLEESCYVCARIEANLSRMFDTVLLLYRQDGAFRRKLAAQPYFCLPHYRRLLIMAKAGMSKKEFAEFYETVSALEKRYAETLSGDVSWFCKKFDYRYQDEPWNNAKDAVERSIRFLSGNEGGGPAGGERR